MQSSKFRKKPIAIDAIQIDAGNVDEMIRLATWCGGRVVGDAIVIDTLEGEMRGADRDWIIKGVAGEFYPCKPDIFAASYENIPIFCCFMGGLDQSCDADAEYLIQTVRAIGSGRAGIAGPDPYCDDTHACAAHVGDLLGMQPDVQNPEEVYWHVAPIEWDPYVHIAPPNVAVVPGNVSPT